MRSDGHGMDQRGTSDPSEIAARPAGLDRLLWRLVLGGVCLAVICLVSGISVRDHSNALALVYVVLDSGPRAGLYLVACVGWGILAEWTLGRTAPGRAMVADRAALVAGLGVSCMLTISHGLGVLGAWGGMLGLGGRVWALIPILIGLLAAAWPAGRALHRGVDLTRLWAPLHWTRRVPIALAWLCGGSVLVVAACNPPGALWSSEFGGYDVLSYHLQLPKEWLRDGVVRPLDHNVYSFLPGYVEAAFTHLGAMTGSQDLLARDGTVLLSCQLLSAGFTIVAAWLIGRVARAAARRGGVSEPSATLAGAATTALVIVVPWMLVVGSLAYNESALVLLLAAALVPAIDHGNVSTPDGPAPTPRSAGHWLLRGLICGWLVATACGVKPTALFLGAPIAGILFLGSAPRRAWLPWLAGACIAGAAGLTPWLVRNWHACGNPVFPQMASFFGDGNWSAEQLARYARAHHFDGTLLDRLRLLVLPDGSDPMGPRHRGLVHEQWAWFFPAAAAACLALATIRRARNTGMLLAGSLAAQLLAWLELTHVQSRFLLPLVIPGSVAVGLLLGIANDARTLRAAGPGPRWPAWTGSLLGLILWGLVPAGTYAVLRYLAEGPENRGPNVWLTDGPGALSGSIFRAAYEQMPEDEQRQSLSVASPTIYCNFGLKRGSVVCMIGDATPLYYTTPVIYSTTYDLSVFAAAVRKFPEAPARWVDALKQRGITHVLINYGEISRLSRSGWIDPAITPEAIGQSIVPYSQVERAWGDRTVVLYRLP